MSLADLIGADDPPLRGDEGFPVVLETSDGVYEDAIWGVSLALWLKRRGIGVRSPEGLLVDASKADLAGVDLAGSDLTGYKMSWANLTGADLEGTVLREADLFGADLRGAKLTGAKVTGANFTGAEGVDLAGTDRGLGPTVWDRLLGD